ncbi:MAG: HYR domain-containing protein, partial [Bacteroidota bacterium]
CSFDLTVIDDEAPTVDCPESIEVDAMPGACTAIVNFDVPYQDNCSDLNLVLSSNSGDAFDLGTTQVTATATDDSGNSSLCSFDIIVNTGTGIDLTDLRLEPKCSYQLIDAPTLQDASLYEVVSIDSSGLKQSSGAHTPDDISDDAWINRTLDIVELMYTLRPVSFDNCPNALFTVGIPIFPDVNLESQETIAASGEPLSYNSSMNAFFPLLRFTGIKENIEGLIPWISNQKVRERFFIADVQAHADLVQVNLPAYTIDSTLTDSNSIYFRIVSEDVWENPTSEILPVTYTIALITTYTIDGKDYVCNTIQETITAFILPKPRLEGKHRSLYSGDQLGKNLAPMESLFSVPDFTSIRNSTQSLFPQQEDDDVRLEYIITNIDAQNGLTQKNMPNYFFNPFSNEAWTGPMAVEEDIWTNWTDDTLTVTYSIAPQLSYGFNRRVYTCRGATVDMVFIIFPGSTLFEIDTTICSFEPAGVLLPIDSTITQYTVTELDLGNAIQIAGPTIDSGMKFTDVNYLADLVFGNAQGNSNTVTIILSTNSTSNFDRFIKIEIEVQKCRSLGCLDNIYVRLNDGCTFPLLVKDVAVGAFTSFLDSLGYLVIVNDGDLSDDRNLVQGVGTFQYGLFSPKEELLCWGNVITSNSNDLKIDTAYVEIENGGVVDQEFCDAQTNLMIEMPFRCSSEQIAIQVFEDGKEIAQFTPFEYNEDTLKAAWDAGYLNLGSYLWTIVATDNSGNTTG